MNAPLPSNEASRLESLEGYEILDTASDEIFERTTRLASTILKCPISLISFVDKERQWFKSHLGLKECETPRSVSFCAHAILSDDILVIEDATKDERFCDNPLVVGDPKIRFYAGAPLITADGHKLGTLCVIDSVSREVEKRELDALRDLASMVIVELELRKLSSTDCLTKSFNRRHFMELTGREIARANRYKMPLSLLSIDVDNFRSFNNDYGHYAGDLALVNVVAEVRKVLRESDALGRLGVDEFAVLLPHTDLENAKLVAQKLCAAVSNAKLMVGKLRLDIKISIGIVQLNPDGDSIKDFLERGDRALYAAKRSGRNRAVLAEAG
jgi:diguanylate cyclase (GGDEF)-like protein